MSDDGDDATPVQSAPRRIDQFRELAERIDAGELFVPPRMLTGDDRRLHVRSTLREDHATRIEEKATGTGEKFAKLADSVFSFYRGTALLFYRDMVGSDGHMPTVLTLGDVHPENFGVMPNSEGVPIFSVNDFDEVIYAPFTWDIKRGAVGFWMAAKEEGESGKHRRKIVRSFVRGYAEAMEDYAQSEHERNEPYMRHNAPDILVELFDDAWEEREEWLWDDYLKSNGRGFRSNDELEPVSSRIEEFQEAINTLAENNGIDVDSVDRAGELQVKDVCKRHGQGTASLGLTRYYVLIEGPSRDATDDIIIEFKRARRSALTGLVPPNDFDAGDRAERIAHGQQVQLAQGDIFYGAVEIDGESFMSRERAPFRDDVDLDDLSTSDWKEYAGVCGRALAQAHALSDDLGQVDYDVEPSIVEACRPLGLFVDDITRFTHAAAKRVERDHEMFVDDFELGAFDQTDRIYR